MRLAYLDCSSGISGDMTLAALLDCGADLHRIQSAIDSLNLKASLSLNTTRKCALAAKKLQILAPNDPTHRNLCDILELLAQANISTNARRLATRIFERLAKAEARVHGIPLDQVHFHEVGAIDSIIDILGTAIAWDQLAIDSAQASAVPTGTGQVKISHGLFPIPAPATAELLRSIPIAPCSLPHEMTTPTGAAILAELATSFGPMPAMQFDTIGLGAGTRDLPDRPNILRIFIGLASNRSTHPWTQQDSVVLLETNLDDISPEQIGFAIERLWAAGALDVFCTPIQMKKNRPGTLLSVLAPADLTSPIEHTLFQHTGTLGIRKSSRNRLILHREHIVVESSWGPVPCKLVQNIDGSKSLSPEFDPCSKIAAEHSLSLPDVIRSIENSFRSNHIIAP
jgi:uncharacterized protein (TIGR00299 family) protein